jgi:excisionase family DNA binding protein
MGDLSTEYLTTRELAELLHIKERKVYDLAASGDVPCSRATGKLLFPRRDIEAWIASHSSGGSQLRQNRQNKVIVGSQDPLLEWSLRASGAELATLFDGSRDGLERFENGEAQATALHLYDPQADDWNVSAVRTRFRHAPVALIEFAWRDRGLIVNPDDGAPPSDVAGLKGRRVVPRQAGAGSQVLLESLMAQAGLDHDALQWTDTARTESEAALAVLEGQADAALGLRGLADRLRLSFVPLLRERFDLLVDRAAWFDPPLQALMRFCHSDAFRKKAGELGGYDVDGTGAVHFNGD